MTQTQISLNDAYFEYIDLPLSPDEIEERKLQLAAKNLNLERARIELERQKELIEETFNVKSTKEAIKLIMQELISGIHTIKAKIQAFPDTDNNTMELISVEEQHGFEAGEVIQVRPMKISERINFKSI